MMSSWLCTFTIFIKEGPELLTSMLLLKVFASEHRSSQNEFIFGQFSRNYLLCLHPQEKSEWQADSCRGLKLSNQGQRRNSFKKLHRGLPVAFSGSWHSWLELMWRSLLPSSQRWLLNQQIVSSCIGLLQTQIWDLDIICLMALC